MLLTASLSYPRFGRMACGPPDRAIPLRSIPKYQRGVSNRELDSPVGWGAPEIVEERP